MCPTPGFDPVWDGKLKFSDLAIVNRSLGELGIRTDLIEPSIKYGGGNDTVKEILAIASQVVIKDEETELALSKIEDDFAELESRKLTDEGHSKVKDLRARTSVLHQQLLEARQRSLQAFKETLTKLEE